MMIEGFYVAAISIVGILTVFGVFQYSKRSEEQRILSANANERQRTKEREAEANAKKMPITLYFGSQTGTAEEFAKTTAKKLGRIGYYPKVIDLEDFQPEQLIAAKLVAVYCATYGEGDPPDNALQFHAWLKDESDYETKATPKCLSSVQVCLSLLYLHTVNDTSVCGLWAWE